MSARPRKIRHQIPPAGDSVLAKAQRALANGNGDAAVNLLMGAVRSSPTSSQLWFALGETCARLNRLEGAVAAIRQACVLEPTSAKYRIGLADAFYTSGSIELALAEYQRAAELEPGNATAWANAGALHQQTGNPTAALGVLGKALEIDPQHPIALNNSGLSFSDIGEFELARDCLRLAVEVKPDYEAARWNKAILDLLHGDFEEGWKGHEARFVQLSKMGALRSFPEPRWNGQRFDGKRLLVWPEQGLGDQLQFVRFIPQVKALGGTVVLMCAAPLRDLFQAVVPCADEVVVVDTPYEQCDLQIPLMSLPFVLGIGDNIGAARVHYISAPGEIPERLGELLPPDGDRQRVGVVWAGQPRHQNDRNRSIALGIMADLFNEDGIEWVSVQKGDIAEADLTVLNLDRQAAGQEVVLPLGPELSSFIDTAHALSRLDLVITVDTAVAHLAGAIGVPCWIMIPFNPDWRWQLKRSDSPWYPSVRLFRQHTIGDWQSVIEAVRRGVRELASSRNSSYSGIRQVTGTAA